MKNIIEICCGSLEDAINAEKGGADRIELNDAMFLSGITPSLGLLEKVLEHCNIPVISMLRPRPGGFYYNEFEFETMLKDLDILVKTDVQGVAFGFINEKREIDIDKTKIVVDILTKNNKDAIFHRAFDSVKDPLDSIEILINLGVKRVLTSGLKNKAINGINLLEELNKKHAKKIELLVGGGVDEANIEVLIRKTGISQYHSSCKTWRTDPTTISNVSFSFSEEPHQSDYNIVDYNKVVNLVNAGK